MVNLWLGGAGGVGKVKGVPCPSFLPSLTARRFPSSTLSRSLPALLHSRLSCPRPVPMWAASRHAVWSERKGSVKAITFVSALFWELLGKRKILCKLQILMCYFEGWELGLQQVLYFSEGEGVRGR